MSSRLLIRTELTSECTPPWTGIAFVHPVDSDELAENLKRSYPRGRTLRERKHMAVIDFFREELLQMQQAAGVMPMAGGAAVYAPSVAPVLHRHVDERISRPSHSPASSTCSAAAEMQGHTTSIAAVAPADTVPGQQFVFSAADGTMMQSKRKRKMTLDEKTAYKETRRRGACSKCKRQKGKCTHLMDATTMSDGVSTAEETSKRLALPQIDSDRNCQVVVMEPAADPISTQAIQPLASEHPGATNSVEGEVLVLTQPHRYVSKAFEDKHQFHADPEILPRPEPLASAVDNAVSSFSSSASDPSHATDFWDVSADDIYNWTNPNGYLDFGLD